MYSGFHRVRYYKLDFYVQIVIISISAIGKTIFMFFNKLHGHVHAAFLLASTNVKREGHNNCFQF